MICYKNEVILKKLNYFFKTIPRRLYMIFSNGRLGVGYADRYNHCAMATGSINCTLCTVQVAY